MQCYLYCSHWKYTNAKRWHNTLARHSKQFTLHAHLVVATHTRTHTGIHLNRHSQTITCLLNLFVLWLIFFPFCYNTVSIIIYNQHDPLFAVPIYSFFHYLFLSVKHTACTLYTWLKHPAHGSCIWISSTFHSNFFLLLWLFVRSFVVFILRAIYFMNAIEFVEIRGVEHQESSRFFWNVYVQNVNFKWDALFCCCRQKNKYRSCDSAFVGILIVSV